jgi:hypothetical protein
VQNAADGHDIAPIPPPVEAVVGSTGSGAVQRVPFQRSALPSPSTAMQKVAEGHDTEVSPAPLASTACGGDQEVPFQVMTRPRVSTAAQKDRDGQDTAVISTLVPPGSMETGADQLVPSQRSALFPDSSTAMQNDGDGHETERRLPRAGSTPPAAADGASSAVR